MKKTSSFLMAVALLLTMLVPMFAVGVVAAEITGTGYTATTDSTGAVASFTKDGTTYYVDTLAEAFAVGAEADNGVTEVDLVANQTITLTSAEAITVDAAKSFTIKGNGCTITDDGSFGNSTYFMRIKGTSVNTVVTLDGFTMKMAAGSNNVRTLDVGEQNNSAPVTVVLKNTSVLENRKSYQTILIGLGAKLVLDEGAVVKQETDCLWSNLNATAILAQTGGAVEVRNGATVIGYERAIAPDGDVATSVLVNGGSVSATANGDIAIAIVAGGSLEVNGGTITSTNGDMAVVSTGTATINGGTITGKTAVSVNSGTATIGGGTFIATHRSCVAAVNSGTSVIVNGGTFTTASNDLVLADGWGLITARYSGATATVNGGNYYYPMAGSNGGGHVLQTKDSATLVFNGGSVYATPHMVNNGSTDNWHVRFSGFAIEEGASVRTVKDETGIRFTSTISAADISLANSITKKEGTAVTYGTVIAPYDFVQQVDVFTMAALDAADIKFGGASVAADKKYVNIVAKDGITTDADGNVTFRAALVNLDESNFARDFAAIPYISYETDGGTVIIYGNFDAEKNVRSMRQIAYEAIADVKTAIETDYATKVESWYVYENEAWVEKTGTAYSCYSKAQLEVIKAYLPEN